ncbi:MAG TPA: aspartate aminotransferase family protein [Anaerolineae bacterium]|nr:aspartate aminotransferase family protein [Anaerolineae bacterium]
MERTGWERLRGRGKEEVVALFARHVSSGKVRFFETAGIDFVLGRREGPYLWDLAGEKRLIDCHCNGGVFNLGHRNHQVIQTLMQSLQELDIGNHHLISEQRATLADRLAELSPGGALTYTVFGVGGGEAVDLAIKVARGYTGRPKVISAKGGYHGHTGLALAAGDEKYRAPFGPMAPGFMQVPFNNIKALESVVDDETAAVILETVPATYGMPIPSEGYFPQVRELCDRKGALLIVDEIQTGLGRTGKLWGIEHFDVVPDIMVIGKGLSGGIYPMAATCFKEKCEAVFHPDPFIHISTFGGAEVGCPVALKVLEMSSDPTFLSHVEEIAGVFSEGFKRLREKHPRVLIGLRQLGLMMGIEMVNEHCGPLFSRVAYDSGFLSVYANNDPRVAQLLPPLLIDRPLAEEILERVDKALEGVERIVL